MCSSYKCSAGVTIRGAWQYYPAWVRSCTRGRGWSCHVKFAVVNLAVGNFAEPPGVRVCPPPAARVHSVYCKCARNSRRTLNFAWEISRSI